jgi:hypothetical protein
MELAAPMTLQPSLGSPNRSPVHQASSSRGYAYEVLFVLTLRDLLILLSGSGGWYQFLKGYHKLVVRTYAIDLEYLALLELCVFEFCSVGKWSISCRRKEQ